MITKYDKAFMGGIVPALAAIIFWLLGQYEIQLPVEVQAAVVTLLTALLVYLVPNKQDDQV